MIEIMTFEEALNDSKKIGKRNLLLGNGFSIACKPETFSYPSLYEQADFSVAPEVEKVFEKLVTSDFEIVIKTLEDSATVLPVYTDENTKEISRKLKNHADEIKKILIATIVKSHPEKPSDITDDKFNACRLFLSHFINAKDKNDGRIYTLNYDLLLYWTLMHNDDVIFSELNKNDGFGYDDDEYDENDYLIWKGENTKDQRIHYLHGALHLFDAGHELNKYSWSQRGISLIQQTTEAISKSKYPLFVSESTWRKKLSKIKHHAYLHHAYKSFCSIMGQKNQTLFIYGHSLADNDDHILTKIRKGKIPCIYVGLYGDIDSDCNKKTIASANKLKAMRSNGSLQVKFYDAASANVWGTK